MKFNIVVLPGDGIGPEIIDESVKVMNAVGKKFGHEFNCEYALIGGVAIDEEGTALSQETIDKCKKSDAVLLGAVGDPRFDDPQAPVHPEDGLLAIRKELGLFANLRPVCSYPSLLDHTNFKPQVLKDVDFIFVRELTGGLYFGQPKKRWEDSDGRWGIDSMLYSEHEIARIVRVAFEIARTRKKKLISVDKANVLQSSRLWRQVAVEISKEYPDVELEHMLVDACAMRLIQNPRYLDVLVTENTFGDILTDEASMLGGSLGMLASASLAGVPKAGERTLGMYEPSHGSAPRHKGLNDANPIATILSMAMMLNYSFGLSKEAAAVEDAISKVLSENYATYDIMGEGSTKVTTSRMGDLIAERI
ncbi:MAG: 3-isopropylmalate dehydrogenase [Dehalococcoidales bacterium]|jgi:3-isopropylmalate dehydrogenase|nr:3-isopropylmalate dehydrogenase [Dehalococcoidales bacterium]MDD3994866.1 3-isopropylmalate dehydrogenase [Dehalococcoidales bacterium]NLT28819.1 3-isopropylmalate dehydrogenase [Dehalococcoidales bacterium]